MTQNLAPIVTVFGGSGFVGRYVVEALAHAGYRVRVAVRRPNEATFTMTYGNVGQVQTVQANIRDDASTKAAIQGAEVVVNCVGILVPNGKQQFDEVQAEGAGRIAAMAAEAGVSRMVHVSAIGADAESDSLYAQSKAQGEANVLAAFPAAVILRPSIVFGPEDEFFNRFGSMAASFPILPVVSGDTKFQPVHVGDVAKAALLAVQGKASGVYELGGPDVETFREIMQRVVRLVRRRRVLVNVPMFVAKAQAWAFDFGSKLSFGLVPNNILTADQVKLLAQDNIVSADAQSFADLGIQPTDMDAILDSYMWMYRDQGQFNELIESAKSLR